MIIKSKFLVLLSFLLFSAHYNLNSFGQIPPGLNDTESKDKYSLSAKESLNKMTLPEGFEISLFAHEPDILQPIAMTFDDRGRLWVIENFSYPYWHKAKDVDRVSIYEDKDNDGQFDTKKVFLENGCNLTSIELGFGGVWLISLPHLIFIPDRDQDDKPDGPAQILLDGFNEEDSMHNCANGLTWSPDGWLWGRHGVMGTSYAGKPGTPKDQRMKMNAGIWRYHPTKHILEDVAHGTVNPWAIDFDDHGQAFMANNVIEHLWHLIPGGRYKRQWGEDNNPYTYDLMQTAADHIHWGGGDWMSSRGAQGVHSTAGGGHSHSGAVVYLGDNFPDKYRGDFFVLNIHGNRMNRDTLRRHKSGYIGSHAPDFLLTNHNWFRPSAMTTGPDGGLIITDWHDTGECHDFDEISRSTGRIYKITYGKSKPLEPFNLAKLSNQQLIDMMFHKNDFYVRHARRILQERSSARTNLDSTRKTLLDHYKKQTDITRKLRFMWALYAVDGLTESFLLQQLDHSNEHIRCWAVRYLTEEIFASKETLDKLAKHAKEDTSALVCLHIASGLQRYQPNQYWPIAENLAANSFLEDDHNLTMMCWYAIEPLIKTDANKSLYLLSQSTSSTIRQFITRRFASELSSNTFETTLEPLIRLLSETKKETVQLDILHGLQIALADYQKPRPPQSWNSVYNNCLKSNNLEIQLAALQVARGFGDLNTIERLTTIAEDHTIALDFRQKALSSLIDNKTKNLSPILHGFLTDQDLCGLALRGLASYDDDSTAKAILDKYETFDSLQKQDAINTLATRKTYALALLQQVDAGKISPRDLDTFNVQKIQKFYDKEINRLLKKNWGSIRPKASAKKHLQEKYENLLTEDALENADRSNGRVLYNARCFACHKLFGEGSVSGPELTGSDRKDVNYMIENILYPNALIPDDYQLCMVRTKSGSILAGSIKKESEKSITLQTPNDQIVINQEDIEKIDTFPNSMMPDGLLLNLTDQEIIDLFSYLASDYQVPLPKD